MNVMVRGDAVQVPIVPFEEAVGKVIEDLLAAVRDLTRALPESIRRAVDLERALRIERKLAWQIFRLSRANGLAEATNIPSLASALRVCDAARARGVPEPVLEQFKRAFERFENFAIEQCGDRAGLLSMISGLTHGQSESMDLRVRKSLFRGNAHAWGLQADVMVRTQIYDPCGPADETLRSILISGNLGLQSLRRNEPLTISSWYTTSPLDKGVAGADPAGPAPRPQFELLRDFCSANLPEVIHVPGKAGAVETEMLIPVGGRAGAVTIYLTQATAIKDARAAGAFAGIFISVPSTELITELLVPAGYTSPASARVAVFGRRHHPERVFEERAIDLFPQRENAVYLGRLTSSPAIDTAPSHHEAVREVLKRQGLLGRQFDIYRCRVLYPQMHTLVLMRVDGVSARWNIGPSRPQKTSRRLKAGEGIRTPDVQLGRLSTLPLSYARGVTPQV